MRGKYARTKASRGEEEAAIESFEARKSYGHGHVRDKMHCLRGGQLRCSGLIEITYTGIHWSGCAV